MFCFCGVLITSTIDEFCVDCLASISNDVLDLSEEDES